MDAIDGLNHKYHKDVVRIATQDPHKHKMRQEHLSKHFTTNIKDILTVGV